LRDGMVVEDTLPYTGPATDATVAGAGIGLHG